MNNFYTRTLTGAGFVVLMLGSAFLGQVTFSFLMLMVVYLGMSEFTDLIERSGEQPQKFMALFGGLILYSLLAANATGRLESEWLLLILPVLFLVFIAELWRNKPEPFRNIAWTLLSILYIALPSGLLIYFFDPSATNGGLHYGVLVGFLAILWINDTFAYLVGSLMGKHRLFERISPKKSWEGSIGGGIFALAVAYGISFLFTQYLPWQWMVMALLIVVFGTLGDLVESMLKRSLGVKDSGTILPGHGGILDRFDAVLISVPFVFVFLTLFC